MKDYLTKRGVLYKSPLVDEIRNRTAGKKYTINDHIRAMIYALLTNQTRWVTYRAALRRDTGIIL